MRRLRLLTLAVPFVLLACGGSDAGSVFDNPSGDDTGTSSTTDTGGSASDTSMPIGDDSDVPPPVDSGVIADDTSAPVDTGGGKVDTGSPTVDTGVRCLEPGSKTYEGHCYFPTAISRYWPNARDLCIMSGAHLATITSAGEQAVVASIASGDRWIGLARPEGTAPVATSYKWLTAEPVGYTNWQVGEPNGSGYCARLRGDGTWADYGCATNLTAICERE